MIPSVPTRTEQVCWAAFNPLRLSRESDSRLIKASETIQLINGRDKHPFNVFIPLGLGGRSHTSRGNDFKGEKPHGETLQH